MSQVELTDENVRERVLRILGDVTDRREVLDHPNLPLFETGALDSLGTVNLILALDEEFDLTISPADLDREEWASPGRIVADVLRRIHQEAGLVR